MGSTGQPATPTRLGKEMMVFVERLDNELVSRTHRDLSRAPYPYD